MGLAMKNRQFAKVLIQCHQNPALSVGQRKNLGISRVFRPVPGPHNIMAGGGQG